jgi:RHS repeat-associated protein
MTSSTGVVAGTTTYDAYGNTLATTGTATTPLGYDGQYTNSDTGLIYLRAREYDPTTGQFMSVDPKVAETREAYGYAKDDPSAFGDPSGDCVAVAASISGPHFPVATPEECEKKLNAISRIAGRINRRLKELVKDEHELPPAEIQTHVNSLNEAARALEKVIAAFKFRGCQETLGVQIPSAVVQLAELRWRVEVTPA